MTEFFFKGTTCGTCDKYQVWSPHHGDNSSDQNIYSDYPSLAFLSLVIIFYSCYSQIPIQVCLDFVSHSGEKNERFAHDHGHDDNESGHDCDDDQGDNANLISVICLPVKTFS